MRPGLQDDGGLGRVGLALVDLASGEMRALEGGWSETRALVDELFRSSPKEILSAEGADEPLARVLARQAINKGAKADALNRSADHQAKAAVAGR